MGPAARAAGGERVLEREEAAEFGRFVRERGTRAFQFAFRLTGNAEEAHDLVQEAFYRALRSLDRFDAARSLDAWFFRILRNIFLDVRKRYDTRHKVSLETPAGSVCEDGPAYGDILAFPEPGVMESLERKEVSENVRAVLAELSCGFRAVLTLCDMQGLTYEEISQVLGIPPGTVRSRLSRARREFRRRLLERMEVRT